MKQFKVSKLVSVENNWPWSESPVSASPALKADSLIARLVKDPPAMQETPVQFLGLEDPLAKGQATHSSILGLPWWFSRKRMCLQCGRPGLDPWVGKIPWRRKQLPTPVFWPGEFHGLYSPWGCKKLNMTEQASLSFHFPTTPQRARGVQGTEMSVFLEEFHCKKGWKEREQ